MVYFSRAPRVDSVGSIRIWASAAEAVHTRVMQPMATERMRIDRLPRGLSLAAPQREYKHAYLISPSNKSLLFSMQEYSISSQSVRSLNLRLLVQGLVNA